MFDLEEMADELREMLAEPAAPCATGRECAELLVAKMVLAMADMLAPPQEGCMAKDPHRADLHRRYMEALDLLKHHYATLTCSCRKVDVRGRPAGRDLDNDCPLHGQSPGAQVLREAHGLNRLEVEWPEPCMAWRDHISCTKPAGHDGPCRFVAEPTVYGSGQVRVPVKPSSEVPGHTVDVTIPTDSIGAEDKTP